jgi:hypothetical protein
MMMMIMMMSFWVLEPYRPVGRSHVSEIHTVSIFKVEVCFSEASDSTDVFARLHNPEDHNHQINSSSCSHVL